MAANHTLSGRLAEQMWPSDREINSNSLSIPTACGKKAVNESVYKKTRNISGVQRKVPLYCSACAVWFCLILFKVVTSKHSTKYANTCSIPSLNGHQLPPQKKKKKKTTNKQTTTLFLLTGEKNLGRQVVLFLFCQYPVCSTVWFLSVCCYLFCQEVKTFSIKVEKIGSVW